MEQNLDDPIPAIAHIRRSSTGETRQYDFDYYGDYTWDEGNYSCDCNRALFFARAKGEEDPEDRPCGEEAYFVRITAADDGRELYCDTETVRH
jgi:hypothetical protein